MREIKFRVWDKSNKIMYKKAMVGNFPDTVPVVWTNYACQEGWYHIEPKESEVMQYTGFKDKDGKEIYEGDILQFYNEEDYLMKPGYTKVIFEDGAFCCKHHKYGTEYLSEMDIDYMEIAVVGNIYENPDLI